MRLQRGGRLQHGECGPHSTAGVVLVGARVTEVDQHAVAEQLRDVAFVWRDR